MLLFIVLGGVVLIALGVLGVLFFLLEKEGQKKVEEKAVPVTDLDQLRKEMSYGTIEPQKPKATRDEPEIIPAFTPKVSLPTQSAVAAEDDVYKKRAKELEDELLAISQKAEGQSDEAKFLIANLTKENESLKSQQADLEQAQQKLIELQGEASNLKIENVSLQTQLESTNTKVHFLEEEMAAVKIQMGEEISRANETVAELSREKEALLQAPKPEADQALGQELEILKSEQAQLKQKYDDLERAHQKLRELNAHLIEKGDLLQYELIKARAQSSGLERVSFNYKNQLEDFLEKINTVKVTNDQLSQVKNRLEGMVEKVKLENEDLVKKDQLAQFELEKNRSRLVNLERECEDLKARVQTKIPVRDVNKVRFILFIAIVCLCSSCETLDHGVDNTVEVGKTLWGSSTRALEQARDRAISKTYNKSYWDCVRSSAAVVDKQHWVMFKKDEIKGYMVVMGVKGCVNTTEIGIFFDELSDTQTQIEISSLSTNAKRKVAKYLFHGLDIAFGYLPPDAPQIR